MPMTVLMVMVVVVVVPMRGVGLMLVHGLDRLPDECAKPFCLECVRTSARMHLPRLPPYDVRMSASTHMAGAQSSQEQRNGERLEVAASVLALLADRTRLALLQQLGEGEADVTTLTEACGAARPSVSQHLAKLRLAGLVVTRKDGRRVVYSLRHGHLRRLVDEALNVADHQIGALPPHD